MARKASSIVQTGHTILVIEGDPARLASTRKLLASEGHRVLTAADGKAGLAIMKRDKPGLILVDPAVCDLPLDETVGRIRQLHRTVQIILLTDSHAGMPSRARMHQLDLQGYHDHSESTERLLVSVDAGLILYAHAAATEKQRVGLQYVLDITPDLHRLQPLDELLQGLLWQVEGHLGADNSFLATFSSEQISKGANRRHSDVAVALAEDSAVLSRGSLAIRVGTGKFRSGISIDSMLDRERQAVESALLEKQANYAYGASALPLKSGKQQLGVIYVDRSPAADRDRELLENFASQATAAIESALLYGQNELLFELATKDPITGVFLRDYAMQQFRLHLKRSHRNNLPLSALVVDVDRFREINDQHGHIIGDDALRIVSGLLTDTVRETDCVARYNGDRFLVVLPDTSAEGAQQVGQRLLDRIRKTAIEGTLGAGAIQLSVGCSTLEAREDGLNFNFLHAEVVDRVTNELVKSADASLSLAKHSGKAGEPGIVDWTSGAAA